MDQKRAGFIYGIVLVLVGFAVFYRIPEVSEQIREIEFFSRKMGAVKFSFYMLGIFLVTAGGIRIYKNF